LIILIVSAFNKKAKLWINGRKHWQERLKEAIDKEQPTAWFHCASLGEFEQGRPLIED
ncbi:MAG TPA: 3-deoxy-D-manno-octulosonic acid transferase, partial [Bacteroidales bacterium]|nr:3-deoxy-D-manno-octulosonic acid transferase [Bacteroidales bacterium]